MTLFAQSRLSMFGVALSLAAIATPTDAAPADDALLKRGQILSLRCSSCHEYAAGKPHKVGPNLHGFFGRKAGAAAGYDFSPAMHASPKIWTDATLDQWLEKPSAVIPGTKMAFVGLAKPEDRKALTAWLRKATR
jgi:cytochrome c